MHRAWRDGGGCRAQALRFWARFKHRSAAAEPTSDWKMRKAGRREKLPKSPRQLPLAQNETTNGSIEGRKFLRLLRFFYIRRCLRFSLRSWQNQIGVFNPLRTQGLGFTIIRGFSVCTLRQNPTLSAISTGNF